MLALPVLAGSAAEAVASYFHLRKGLDLTLARGRSFYAILAAAMLRGVGISLSGLHPVSALYIHPAPWPPSFPPSPPRR